MEVIVALLIAIGFNVYLDSTIKDVQTWQVSEIKHRTKCLAKNAYEKVWGLRSKKLF